MVSFEACSNFPYHHTETRRLRALWVREQFTISQKYFTKTTDDEVTLRINMRRKWRYSEIFRWSLVSQLSEIPSVVQSFLFSWLFHLLFPLAYFYFLQKSNGFYHGAVRYLALPCSRIILYNTTRLFYVYSCFCSFSRFFNFPERTDLVFSRLW